MSAGTKLIDIKEELESLAPYLEGSTQGEAVKFCIRILGERWEVGQQRDRLAEALDTLTAVIGLTPIKGNKEALQEAFDQARAVLAEVEGKGAYEHGN